MFFLLLKGFAYEAPAVIGAAIASIYITYRGGKNPIQKSGAPCRMFNDWTVGPGGFAERGLLRTFTNFRLRKFSSPIDLFADEGKQRQQQQRSRSQE